MSSLDENFKIKNGLTVCTTISAGGSLSADDGLFLGSTDTQGSILSSGTDLFDLFSAGDITGVTTNNGISGGGTEGDVEIGLDSTVVRTSGDQTIAGDKTFSGSALCVSNVIRHTGDPDTCIAFNTDALCLYAGGAQGLQATSDGIVINEPGNSKDFRVEGSTLSAALFVDGSADAVGIGTSTPGELLDVVGGNVQVTDGEFIGDLRGAVNFKAEAGENIAKGEAVYISGISGTTTVVSLADADVAGEYPAFGVAADAATSGNPVTVVQFGDLKNLDTTSWGAEGTELYVGTTAGELVSSAPTGETAALQKLAKVTRYHATAGSITIMGAGRTNAVPNLNSGNFFIGDGTNAPVTATFSTCVQGVGDARYIQGITTGSYLTGGGLTGCVEVGIDSACATKWDTAAAGDISAVTAGAGLSGGGTSGDVTVGLDSATAASLDQSSCPGINCTGTTTNSNTQTFTNKSGNISQWTNDSGYTTCTGTFNTATGGLSSSGGSVGIDAATAANFSCQGTVTSVTGGDGIDSTGGTTPSIAVDNTVLRTSGNQTIATGIKDFQSSICVGDSICHSGDANTKITFGTDAITLCTGGEDHISLANTGVVINEGGLSNDFRVETNTDANAIFADGSADAVGIGTSAPTSKLTVAGTLSAQSSITGETIVKRGGTSSQFLKADGSVDSTAYTTCVGDITEVTTSTDYMTGGGASGSVEVGIDSACTAKWDNSAAGSITEVTTSGGLSGGGSSGSVDVAIDSSTIDLLNQSTCPGINCVGDVTGIDAGCAITIGDGGTATPSVSLTTACHTEFKGAYTTAKTLSGCPGLACVGDMEGITLTAGLTGSSLTTGTACIGIDGASASNWDQSSCPGINCTGTTTASNSQTFTNKSGNISQWTNDSGYTTCNGDITGVTANGGLSGGATSGNATIGIDAATAANFDQSACPGINCTGTTTASNSQTFTNKSGNISQWTNDSGYTTCTGDITAITLTGGISGASLTAGNACIGIDGTLVTTLNQSGCAGLDCTGTTTASNTQTFTNKSGNISQWTNDSGYTTCTGDITSVTAGAGLSGGGSSGDTTIAVDGALVTTLNQSSCPGINCTGTTTASNTQTFTNKSGNISQWTNDSGYTTCTGDITGVTAGSQMTGGATSGTATLNVSLSTGGIGTGTYGSTANGTKIDTITVDEFGRVTAVACGPTGDMEGITLTGGLTGASLTSGTACLAVDGALVTALNQSACPGINCVGDVTGIDAGDGIDVTDGATATPAIAVDSTVVRTTGDQNISGCKVFADNTTIQGNLSVTGEITCIDTIIETTSAVCITNAGTGPALYVEQTGAQPVVNFVDTESSSALYIENGGNVGINDTNPNERLDVNGNINVTGNIKMDDTVIISAGKCFVGNQVQPSTAIADAYISSSAAWNSAYTTTKNLSGCAGLACVGDVTGVTVGPYLTGGGTSGSFEVGIDSACAAAWDSAAAGGVTSVTGGDGIDSTGGTTPDISVDGTVIRTTGNQCINGIKHFIDTQTRFTSVSATGTITGGCLITAGFMESNAPADQVYSQGTVLALNEGGCVVESTQANDAKVFGVAAGDNLSPIVMGAEPICVTGEICVGDFIVTSDKAGHGKKSTQPYPFGTVIGQAMESGCGDSFAIKAMIRKM